VAAGDVLAVVAPDAAGGVRVGAAEQLAPVTLSGRLTGGLPGSTSVAKCRRPTTASREGRGLHGLEAVQRRFSGLK
jgi:hypothetical protein